MHPLHEQTSGPGYIPAFMPPVGASPVAMLVVMIVFFGPLPPWLPLTLQSMGANRGVRFVVVGDAAAPAALPPNVAFEHVSYVEMQARLSALAGKRVAYTHTYKANDIKPLLPALYPRHLDGADWWGWADLDVIFGDLTHYLKLALAEPACCAGLEVPCPKRARRDVRSVCYNSTRPLVAADTFYDHSACRCRNGEAVTAVSPLYPNPWRKKCWGPLTLFRVDTAAALPAAALAARAARARAVPRGNELFRQSRRWREALAEPEYVHFDEWWGPFERKGIESMGDVMTKLSDEGVLVMSKARLPFSEAKSCVDIECTFCPCGAMRFELRPNGTLLVNDEESMVLHLAESKHAWFRSDRAAIVAALPPRTPASPPAPPPCFVVDNLGALSPDPSLRHAAPLFSAATSYGRHRPSSSKAASAIEYLGNATEQPGAQRLPPLTFRPCDPHALAAQVEAEVRVGTATPSPLDSEASVTAARDAYVSLARRYEEFTAAERARALQWLCAWGKLSVAYRRTISSLEIGDPATRRLPELHGNRRVRYPLYGGERLGWWRQTVVTPNSSETSAEIAEIHDLASLAVADGRACSPQPDACLDAGAPRTARAENRAGRGRQQGKGRGRARGRGRQQQAESEPASGRRLGQAGRRLEKKAKKKARRRYDLNTPAVPGRPCLVEPPPQNEFDLQLHVQRLLFEGYLQLVHARRSERGRAQRWKCSWLYKLRACIDAEEAATAQRRTAGGGVASGGSRGGVGCRAISPPDHSNVDAALGWGAARASLHGATSAGIGPLLYQLRCW